MSEHTLWVTVRENLGRWGHFTRIENRGDKGVPDVAYTIKRPIRGASGWIELKHAPRAPAETREPVRFGHPPTLEQVTWLESEARAGGRAWVLAQVASSYFLLPPDALRLVYTEEPWVVALSYAAISADSFPTRELLKVLSE
jgi:hypothetical protein